MVLLEGVYRSGLQRRRQFEVDRLNLQQARDAVRCASAPWRDRELQRCNSRMRTHTHTTAKLDHKSGRHMAMIGLLRSRHRFDIHHLLRPLDQRYSESRRNISLAKAPPPRHGTSDRDSKQLSKLPRQAVLGADVRPERPHVRVHASVSDPATMRAKTNTFGRARVPTDTEPNQLIASRQPTPTPNDPAPTPVPKLLGIAANGVKSERRRRRATEAAHHTAAACDVSLLLTPR